MHDPSELPALARGKRKETNRLLGKLSRMKDREVDSLFHQAHDMAFARIDCLDCANCCKTTGPLFTQRDVERLSKHLNLKPAAFEEQYLRVDEDGDHVLRSVPCTFLNDDHTCSVYEVRPRACREYPHTNRMRQSQIFELTRKNAAVCPAVFEILQDIRKRLNF